MFKKINTYQPLVDQWNAITTRAAFTLRRPRLCRLQHFHTRPLPTFFCSRLYTPFCQPVFSPTVSQLPPASCSTTPHSTSSGHRASTWSSPLLLRSGTTARTWGSSSSGLATQMASHFLVTLVLYRLSIKLKK